MTGFEHLADNDPAAPWMKDEQLGGMQPSSRRASWLAGEARRALWDEAPPAADIPMPTSLDEYGLGEGEPILVPAEPCDLQKVPPLTVEEWRARDLPEPDWLMGHWLSTTSRVQISAPTGLGKSNFAIALLQRCAAGGDFIHWTARRGVKVLYVDGEMSRRLLRQRILDECARHAGNTDAFYALSREDIETFRPLNTPDGQAWLLSFVEQLGIELVCFDNVMSLTIGDMKEELPWQQTLPLVHELTRRGVGQIWIHHTGHDKSRGYGSSTREWQLDVVIHLEKVDRPDTDVSFSFSFTKARERTPNTRFDFQDVKIALVNDRWEHEVSEAVRPDRVAPQTAKALDALINAIASDDAVNLSGGRRAVSTDRWKAECVHLGLIDTEAKAHSARTLFSKFRRELIAANRIACEEDWSWLLR